MGILMYLNPWKALREARSERDTCIALNAANAQLLKRRDQEASEARRIIDTQALRIKMQKEEIVRLTEELKHAVKRDPKTGRLIPQKDKGP